LLSIGGRTSRYRPLADTYCYHSLDDLLARMPTARSKCIAAFVTNIPFVVGGLIESN